MRHRGKTFYVTEKLDGTSFTAFLRQGEFGICSRNLWMDETDESTVLARVAKEVKLEEKLRSARERLGFDLAIQAEVIGPGIQKNKYALPAVTLRVFNVLNVDAYRLLDHGAMLEVLSDLGWNRCRSSARSCSNHTVDETGRVLRRDERAEPAGSARRRRAAPAGGGTRRGHRRPAQLQGDQPEVPAEVRRVTIPDAQTSGEGK